CGCGGAVATGIDGGAAVVPPAGAEATGATAAGALDFATALVVALELFVNSASKSLTAARGVASPLALSMVEPELVTSVGVWATSVAHVRNRIIGVVFTVIWVLFVPVCWS